MNWIPASWDSLAYYPTPPLRVSSQAEPPRYLLGKFTQKNFVHRQSNVLSFGLAQEIRAWVDGHPQLPLSVQVGRLMRIYGVEPRTIKAIIRNENWPTTHGQLPTPSSQAVPTWLLMLPAKVRLVLLFVLMLHRGDPC